MTVRTEKIKLIVCDIDGTIIPGGKHEISRRLKEDFDRAMAKGLKVMINTGRHFTFLQPSLFEDLPMDIIGTINGACVNRRDGSVIEKHPMSAAQMHTITLLSIENNVGLGFKFEDRIVTYANHEKFVEGYVQKGTPYELTVLDGTRTRNHHIEHGYPLGTFMIGADHSIREFVRMVPDLQFAWSFRGGFDVFSSKATKATSVEAALRAYDLKWENVIAFGDAGNDTPFLKPAAIAVAMENGKDDVKSVADIIAPPCKEDGVAKVLEELNLA
jgi:Cof subfamily protein (haloacid dehalogenase superfamily)